MDGPVAKITPGLGYWGGSFAAGPATKLRRTGRVCPSEGTGAVVAPPVAGGMDGKGPDVVSRGLQQTAWRKKRLRRK